MAQTQESDHHPDALACRLRFAMLCLECQEAVSWNFASDYNQYIKVHMHVSVACRMTEDEETQLAGFVPADMISTQFPGIGLRKSYVSAIMAPPPTTETTLKTLAAGCATGGSCLRELESLLPTKLRDMSADVSAYVKYARPEQHTLSGGHALAELEQVCLSLRRAAPSCASARTACVRSWSCSSKHGTIVLALSHPRYPGTIRTVVCVWADAPLRRLGGRAHCSTPIAAAFCSCTMFSSGAATLCSPPTAAATPARPRQLKAMEKAKRAPCLW